MDQGPLVEKQIDGGRKLIDQLAKDNFDVTAAFWLKESEDGQWLFYIASKVVDKKGLTEAYGEVHSALKALPDILWAGASELKLIGATNPITTDVLNIRQRRQTSMPTRYFGNRLGKISIEEACIYLTDPTIVLTHGKGS